MNRELERIIDRFENGVERYNRDPFFNVVVNSIYHNDADVYALLDDTLQARYDVDKAFNEYAKNDVRELKIQYEIPHCKVCGATPEV